MKTLFISSILVSLLTLDGCATSEKVQPVQLGDHELSCKQIQAEMKKLDDSQAQVEDKKGINGTNVAAAVAWLPGLAYTYYDASKANEAISARRSHLIELFESKSCKIVKVDASVAASAAADEAVASTDKQKVARKKKVPAKTTDE